MVRVIFSDGREVAVEAGIKLSEVLKEAGRLADFPCGGKGKCGKCKVKVAFRPEAHEQDYQEVTACTFSLQQDLWVQASGQPEDLGTVILTGGAKDRHTIDRGDTPPSPADRVPRGAADDSWGLAVDIGTTTVVGYLVNLSTGVEAAVGAELNSQRVYGADVISRITAAQNSPEKLKDMQRLIIGTINSIIETTAKKAKISPGQISSVTLAGNTCMHHLLLGLNPKTLGRAPFLPLIQQEVVVAARELGLGINPDAVVWVFPVIAGFVGGDTVGAVLATNLQGRGGIRLLVDIGTNGELVLSVDGRMTACSAAAGPALEGAQVLYGMRAENGAISRVRLLPEIETEVIGNAAPKGICGSGLIDLLGELVRVGALTLKGGFVRPQQYTGPEQLRRRIIPGEKGCRFVLVRPEENNGQEISLTQDDVLQLQLAKGALHAAMALLVENAGITGEQVEEILLAGAFGNFLDPDQALTIGLFPEWAAGKITQVGNAAGEGARAVLLDPEKRAEAVGIGENTGFLELAGTKEFSDAFIKGIIFRNAG